MEPALDAIRGHKSAHSFATGPVIAEPAHQICTKSRSNDSPQSITQYFHTATHLD